MPSLESERLLLSLITAFENETALYRKKRL
jgi:hypothetical protein